MSAPRLRSLGLLFILLLAAGPAAAFQEAPHIESFAPQGTVKRVRQVQVRFSEPMVPFGDPQAASDPFEIECPAAGTARWVDSQVWVYDFERDLPAGLRCRFTLRADLDDLQGQRLQGQRVFEFSTGGPAIIRSRPWKGRQVVEDQVFILELDAPATAESVLEHAYFSIEGSVQRVGVRVIEDPVRREILEAAYRRRLREEGVEDRLLLVAARLRFPQDKRINLIWGAGIATPSGVATTEDQVLPFTSRPAFFARFTCTRENAESPCVALTPMRIDLSAPIRWEDALKFELAASDGRRFEMEQPSPPPEWTKNLVFRGPFPAESVFEVTLPPDLRDDSGRPLVNQLEFPLQVRTAELPPLAKFAARFGILESEVGGVLPVTVRNLEADLDFAELDLQQPPLQGRSLKVDAASVGRLQAWLRRIHNWAQRNRSIFQPVPPPNPEQAAAEAPLNSGTLAPGLSEKLLGGRQVNRFTLPKPNGAKAFEVMGIPLQEPGFYVVELESRVLGQALLGTDAPMYVPTSALVTNLGVHFKWGIENSLAWVTRLDSGEPAEGVQVQVWDCRSQLLGEAATDSDGIAWLSGIVPPSDAPECSWEDYEHGLLVTARQAQDFSFVHTSWDEGIEPWRFQLPTQWDSDLVSARTLFDRPLFRPGETVHMKHLVRLRTGQGFALLSKGEQPVQLRISHDGSDQKYEHDLEFDAGGTAVFDWQIPGQAKLGSYSVQLVLPLPEGREDSWRSGSFRVEEFRVPLMRGTIRWPEQEPVSPSRVEVDLSAQFLGGGPAGLLPLTFHYQIEPVRSSRFPDFEGFTFATPPIEEGVFRSDDRQQQPEPQLQTQSLTLDEHGSARVVIEDIPRQVQPARIQAEMEFRDPNGQVQTVSSRFPIWSSRWLVGIKPESWAASQQDLGFEVAVVDTSGQPISGVPVVVEIFENVTRSHRKRLVGGFYAYEHMRDVRRLDRICEGRTDDRGLLECEGTTAASGNLVLQARIQDLEGRPSFARRSIWVSGGEPWWFEVSDDDRIDLIPERDHYEPGQEAIFQVRMPFREATALVTIEREGITSARVEKLSGRGPLLRIPVEDSFAPNVFVSALVVRGRVAGVRPTALVDLGKPALKLGTAQIQVGWRAHRLKVEVSTDRQVYQVRDTAVVDVTVTPEAGDSLPAGAEIALAAVDEGLLELLPNPSWDLLSSMMGSRGYGVRTSTGQLQVVGKRHFGLKALPQGGGGGRGTTRDLFDTLLLWRARVPLDENGRARIKVPLNDSLTSFRIAAIAHAGPDRFGSGSTTIRSTQDLILFSGIPPLVRAGDEFEAGFTLRNASERDLEVDVKASIQPAIGRLPVRRLRLGAGQSRLLSWKVTAPDSTEPLRYRVEVQPRGDGRGDALEVTQEVIPAVPVRTFQATLSQLAPAFSTPVEPPPGALPGRGGLRLKFSPSLLVGLDSVRDYMDAYPYTCLEQVTSKAVALGDTGRWREIVAALPAFLDGDGLAKYFPSSRWGSDALTAYLVSVTHQRGWSIPEPALARMLDGLAGFVEGRVVRHSRLPTTDLALRKLAALEAISRHRPIRPQELDSIAIQPNLWPTSGVIDWMLILHRTPALPDAGRRLDEAEQILRARLTLQGTTMGFSTERRDRLWWLMVSPDLNAVRLVLALLETGRVSNDLPRLMVGALERRRRGHWDLTVANAWGVLAAEAFSARFEGDPVAGLAVAQLQNQPPVSWDWQLESQGGAIELDWPESRARLTVRQQGSGAPWVALQSRAAIPLQQPLSNGYHIVRSVTPVRRQNPGQWTAGDVARVRLELQAQSDMAWVVVDDPIPAGASILGSGLGGDSSMLSAGERSGGAWPTFEERSFRAFRAYYSWVPKGDWVVEYTVRLNNAGRFKLPPTRVEALYHPESFAELPNSDWEVEP